MLNRIHVLAIAATVLTAGAAAVLAPSEPAPSAGPDRVPPCPAPRNPTRCPVHAWNWSGTATEFTVRPNDLGWIDIAFPATNTTTTKATVTVAFPDPSNTTDRNHDPAQVYMLHGRRTWHGIRGVRRVDDSTWETTVNMESRQHDLAVGDPITETTVSKDEIRIELRFNASWYRHQISARGYPSDVWGRTADPTYRPVYHWTILYHGPPMPTPARVTFRGNDTVAKVTTGPRSDTFAYEMEDFDTNRSVRVDAPGLLPGTMVHDEATLQTELLRGRPRSLVLWMPPTEQGMRVVRPDGTVPWIVDHYEEGFDGPWSVATDLPGTWTFKVPASPGTEIGPNETPRALRYADRPIVWGTSYTPASFSWQEGPWKG